MLQSDLYAWDLSFVGHRSELPADFRALGHSGSPEWVALGDEASRRIYHNSSSVGVLSIVDEFLSPPFWAKSERLVGDELVSGKTIVKFHDLDILWLDSCVGVKFVRGLSCHIVSDQIHRGVPEVVLVGTQLDIQDLNCLVL